MLTLHPVISLDKLDCTELYLSLPLFQLVMQLLPVFLHLRAVLLPHSLQLCLVLGRQLSTEGV